MPLAAHELRSAEVERSLLTGRHAGLLQSCFGDAGYRELRRLAQEAAARSVRGGPRVLILPGIMGSTLGAPGRFLDHVLWLNPIEIARGKLTDLALDSRPNKYKALGVFLPAYLKLKFRLRIAGCEADFFPYDWRQSIDCLGRQLSETISAQRAPQVHLVAHSMGGLVARAAIALGPAKIGRLIMLGTPNYGSFAAVQAIRGVYSVVRKIALLDLKHTARELAQRVFNGFPGLYQMLPSPLKFDGVDLYRASAWPPAGPRPVQQILDGVQRVRQSLAAPDERFILIAGINRETVVGLRIENGEFLYSTSLAGDGTVPVDFAEMPGMKTYYIAESHGSLPDNPAVARAIPELLASGTTAALASRWSPEGRRPLRDIREAALPAPERTADAARIDVNSILEDVASPASPEPVPASPPDGAHKLDRLVISRRRQRRLDIHLVLGSITEVSAPACVLGVYCDVAPAGAARELDDRLDGAITEFTRRRMFSGGAGQVFILPAGRGALRAGLVLLAGLGPFDRFDAEVQKLAGEQVVRTLARTGLDEFATVIPGAGSGWSIGLALQNLLAGFLRGLFDADREQRFRGVTLCEIDSRRYEEIQQELYRLSAAGLFDDVEVTFHETRLPPREAPPRDPEPVYLILRQEQARPGAVGFRSSVLGAGKTASVITGVKTIRSADLAAALGLVHPPRFTPGQLEQFGARLAGLVLPGEVLSVLPRCADHHLVVVHDAPCSRIPWEALRIADWSPAAAAGLSRKYTAANLPVAAWLDERRQRPVLEILLVVDPTRDLAGAEREGDRIRRLFGAHRGVRVEELRGAAAAKSELLAAFRSGRYDVIHYAGHAFFDPASPARSGMVCHGGDVLAGADLAGLGNLPSLVFLNACEAGRVRGPAARGKPGRGKTAGLAEAFLRGGVANFVGTYWPVGDASAEAFASAFYNALAEGRPIGQAVCAGRVQVKEKVKSIDWADYMHYGAHDFVLKQTTSQRRP